MAMDQAMALRVGRLCDLSPKSSFEEMDYDERLLAIEQSRLQALHHSTGLTPPVRKEVGVGADADDEGVTSPPSAGKQRRRGPHRRLAHSLSDSLIIRQRKGRWRGAADASLVAASCAHSGAPRLDLSEVGDADDAGQRRGWVRGRLGRSGRGRKQSSSTSRLPDPTSTPSAVDVAVVAPESSDLEESAARIQTAYRGFRCRKGADVPPASPPARRPSADERAAMYRDQIDTYIPQLSSPEPEPVSPIRLPTQPCAPPTIELVECEDGAVRPSMGLSFAFVTSAEKLGLMLEPQSPDASERPTGELIMENRRRSSSLTNSPAMELDFSAVRLIDDEVQKFVTQIHAPAPKKMPKPKRRTSLETMAVSSPVKCLPRATSSLSACADADDDGATAVGDCGAIPRAQDLRNGRVEPDSF